MFLSNMLKTKFSRFVKSNKGSGGAEYVLSMSIVVASTVGFVAVSSSVMQQGVNVLTADLANPTSLSRWVGNLEIVPPEQELDMFKSRIPLAENYQEYSFDFKNVLIAPAGTSPSQLTFTLIDGTLPSGFTLSTSGVLSGTYSVGGEPVVSEIKVDVATSEDSSHEKYNLIIAPQGFHVLPFTVPHATVNEPYYLDMSEWVALPSGASFDDVTWSMNSGSLPTGLSFDTETATISGTPTLVEEVSAVFQGAISGTSDTRSFVFEVKNDQL